ncbi:MAG: hypothetical protein KJ971_05660 [Firmicutes bacterium]|nr:hypothetical protein [Bacillota bacterium]
MKIAILACSNGLGHVRRVIAISSYILRSGFKGNITAFLPSSHLEILGNWTETKYFLNHPSVSICDFKYPIIPDRKTKSLFEKKWLQIDLPNLDDFDVVWSDNITQVLKDRPDAIITGSFFWHEVFSHSNHNSELQEFIIEQRELIRKTEPIIAGNEYFSTPEIKNVKRFCPVGLYRYNITFKEKKENNILLSCGLGGEEEDVTKTALQRIIEENLKPPKTLFVEKRILPNSYPSWIEKADFSDNMFHNCLAVCIRPGMGTISDSLVNRTRIFSFSTENSFEMEYNSKILEKLGVGESCKNPYDSYRKALEFISDNDKVELQIFRTSHLRTDGVLATAKLITGNY